MDVTRFIVQNPAIWMLSVDGFIVDARDLPLEFQQEAVRRGLIPYVPVQKLETRKEQPTTAATKEAHGDSDMSGNPSPSDSSDNPSPPDDFSDIYDRFRTV